MNKLEAHYKEHHDPTCVYCTHVFWEMNFRKIQHHIEYGIPARIPEMTP